MPLKHHWKDLRCNDQQWAGLAIQCEHAAESGQEESSKHSAPVIRIESGNNSRLRLVVDVNEDQGQRNEQVLYWASILAAYGGVRLLKPPLDTAAYISPLAAIRSPVVQARKHLARDEKMQSWSRYFADELINSTSSMLYEGLWLLAPSYFVKPEIGKKGPWQFEAPFHPQLSRWRIFDVEQSLKPDAYQYLDWWFSGSSQLVNFICPAVDHGRVKWWRKVCREGQLPPILVWYQNCLDAYVIIDGHCRLQAAILEKSPPDFLILYSAAESARFDNTEQQAQILRSFEYKLKAQKERTEIRPLPINEMNQILIGAFENRNDMRARTHAWAKIKSEKDWLQQVKSHLHSTKHSDLFEKMVSREPDDDEPAT
jgi:hypothetical protein